MKTATMPKSAYEATKLVYLPCLKTHNLGRFTMSLKRGMGLIHPGERRAIHMGNLEQKAVEINLAWQPDLIIMDGRKAFVSGGPDKGEMVQPGIIMASGDMVAIDVEGLKVLLSYRAKNKLPENPWDSPQIVTALTHRLGCKEGEYRVLSGVARPSLRRPGHSGTLHLARVMAVPRTRESLWQRLGRALPASTRAGAPAVAGVDDLPGPLQLLHTAGHHTQPFQRAGRGR